MQGTRDKKELGELLNSRKKLLAILVLPVLILVGGAGVGLVVAAEKPYSPPSGTEAFAAAPASLVVSGKQNPATSSTSRASKNQIAALKRKCKKKRGAAKRKCLKRVKKISRPKPKFMSLNRARGLATRIAGNVWESGAGDYDWTDYGLSECRRLGRSSVSCAVYVYIEQDQYSSADYGSSYDCEWVVKSSYLKNGRLQVTNGFAARSCEWL
jgi:hypothetical protein